MGALWLFRDNHQKPVSSVMISLLVDMFPGLLHFSSSPCPVFSFSLVYLCHRILAPPTFSPRALISDGLPLVVSPMAVSFSSRGGTRLGHMWCPGRPLLVTPFCLYVMVVEVAQ